MYDVVDNDDNNSIFQDHVTLNCSVHTVEVNEDATNIQNEDHRSVANVLSLAVRC